MKFKQYNVYTDGSYIPETKQCSYGYIFVDNDEKIKYQYKMFAIDNTGLKSMYAEMKAIMYAVKTGSRMKVLMKIYTDCKTIINILNSKGKKKYSSKYSSFIYEFIKFMEKYKNNYLIEWVRGHSKNIYNNYIDKILKNNDIKPGVLKKVDKIIID